jgi:hypothetical protein
MDMTGVEVRRFPYVWPTWVTGLISGDKQCWWAAWFKAHHDKYPKIADPNQNALDRWKADHAVMVGEIAEGMRREGWVVTTEKQNKIKVKGRSAKVGGCPDIVAVRRDTDDARVIDAKTGKRRDSDYWQVVSYLGLYTLKDGRLEGKQISGAVAYPDAMREISAADVHQSAPKFFQGVATVASNLPLERTPSKFECMRCDIGPCPDRWKPTEEDPDDETIDTEVF